MKIAILCHLGVVPSSPETWANIGRAASVPQVPMVTKVQKSVDVPQIEYEDKIVEVPIQKPVHLALLGKNPYRSVVGGCRFG